jgi:hypothetical protein
MPVMLAQRRAMFAGSSAPREILLIFIFPAVTLTMSAQKCFPICAIKSVKAPVFAQGAEIIPLLMPQQMLALEQGLRDRLLLLKHP